MAGAFWCIVEDDRQGNPKKVTAEVLGEAARLAAAAGGEVEAVWLTDTASEAGLRALGEWGATKVWLVENAALAPYRGEVWTPVLAALVTQASPRAVFAPVSARLREAMARLAARIGAGLSADSVGEFRAAHKLLDQNRRPVRLQKPLNFFSQGIRVLDL